MNMLNTIIRLGVCAGLSLTLAGCLTSTPQWDAHFGDAVRQVRDAQVLDPQAGRNPDPVSGVDGVAAAGTMTRYGKSFAQPSVAVQPYSGGSSTSTP
jgi:hypothetical protein